MRDDAVTLKDLGDLFVYLGAVAAAMVALGVVARFAVVRPMQRWIKAQIKDPALHLSEINAQMSPDHGRSLRDALDRIEVGLQSHVMDPSAHEGKG